MNEPDLTSSMAKEIVKELINDVLVKPLKDRGFRKRRFTWNKLENDIITVINVQLWKYNTAVKSEFTVNLGLFHDEFHKIAGGLPVSSFINEYDCDLRLRISELMGVDDYWWEVSSDASNFDTTKHFKTSVDNHVLPWIDKGWDLESMYSWFSNRNYHFHAAVAAFILKKDSVEELLREYLRTTKKPHAVDNISEWTGKYGIKMDELT